MIMKHSFFSKKGQLTFAGDPRHFLLRLTQTDSAENCCCCCCGFVFVIFKHSYFDYVIVLFITTLQLSISMIATKPWQKSLRNTHGNRERCIEDAYPRYCMRNTFSHDPKRVANFRFLGRNLIFTMKQERCVY